MFENSWHDSEVVWCSDCSRFSASGIDGMGECGVDYSKVFSQDDASHCKFFAFTGATDSGATDSTRRREILDDYE